MAAMPDIRWTRTIRKQPGNYLGWPSIARKADGEILVVFSGDREAHACPYGKIQMTRSRDDGEGWSETICNTVLDDRDPGITVLGSGTWSLAGSTWTSASPQPRRWSRLARCTRHRSWTAGCGITARSHASTSSATTAGGHGAPPTAATPGKSRWPIWPTPRTAPPSSATPRWSFR